MQVTDHLQENAALGKAAALLQMTETEQTIDKHGQENATDVVGKAYGMFVIENGNHKFVRNGRTTTTAEIHPFLVNWILEQLHNIDSPLYGLTCIDLFYEYKRSGILYHSHPDYRGMGPWHDWVMVMFAMNGNRVLLQATRQKHREKYCFQPDEYPCKSFGFLKCHANGEIVAVVQSCKENDHDNDSILYQRWEKETDNVIGGRKRPWLHLVTVNAFGKRVLVVEDDPSMKESEVTRENHPGCTLVLPQQDWWTKQFMLPE